MTASGPDMELAVTPGPLVGPVLRRVVGILAARADLPVDRVDEVILMAEALGGAAAQHVAADRLGVVMHNLDGSIRLEFGPLEPGTSGEALSSAPSNGTRNRAEVRSDDGGDYVVLTVGDGDS